MSDMAVMWMFGACTLIAIVVLIATIRSRTLWSFRTGLILYLAGTAWWSLVDLWRWVAGTGTLQQVEVWTLPAAALVVAGIRVGVHAATRAGWRASIPDVLAFGVHPFLALVVVATPPLWSEVAVVQPDGSVEYGPLFWAQVGILYALLIAATIELLRGRKATPFVEKNSLGIVAAIWGAPLVAGVATLLVQGPNGIDLMPPGFAVVSLLIWKKIVPADMRHAVRIARSQVLEELADAVIVLGDNDQILDANAAALRLVGANGPVADFVDMRLRTVWPQVADAALHPGEYDLSLDTVGDIIVDVSISHLSEGNGAPRGRAVVMRDVTDAVRQRRELAQLRTELADLVVRDAVTGLHNRRYAEQYLPTTLERCFAKRVPLSIAVIDVDHFKHVNDTHGHPVGDRVLRALSHAMLDEVPASMLARIGGEEFLVLLPGLARDQALAHAERLRAACANAAVITRQGEVRVTVSAGVATINPWPFGHPTETHRDEAAESLMEAADAALYLAKRDGRDRTKTTDVGAIEMPTPVWHDLAM